MGARRVCSEPGCPTLTDTGRCVEHRREADRARGGRAARGYGYEHQRLRRRLMAQAEGKPCARCGQPMHKGQALHLDHTDDRTAWLGMSHAACNTAAGGRAAHGHAR